MRLGKQSDPEMVIGILWQAVDANMTIFPVDRSPSRTLQPANIKFLNGQVRPPFRNSGKSIGNRLSALPVDYMKRDGFP